MDRTEELKKVFEEQFKTQAEGVYFAPGRVNLIGEHVDYNGGCVFPCALSLGTYAAVSRRKDRKVLLYSLNRKEAGCLVRTLGETRPLEEKTWAAYPLGVMETLQQAGYPLPCGINMAIWGDLPDGAGLSSSASLEVLTGFLLRDMFQLDFDDVTLAKLCQKSENVYNGVSCGIMDQFAVSLGKKGCAVFLDTKTLVYEQVPLNLKNEKIVLANTCVKHSLASSGYNDRRRACEEALLHLQKAVQITDLCDLDVETFEKIKNEIPDPGMRKKARHAVYENARTKKAVALLKSGDVDGFGRLMARSHASLRDDYLVSCRELDVLVSAAENLPGVKGSRMTGGGFGGCTVSIVEEDSVQAFKEQVTKAYRKATGRTPEIYVADAGDGPRRL